MYRSGGISNVHLAWYVQLSLYLIYGSVSIFNVQHDRLVYLVHNSCRRYSWYTVKETKHWCALRQNVDIWFATIFINRLIVYHVYNWYFFERVKNVWIRMAFHTQQQYSIQCMRVKWRLAFHIWPNSILSNACCHSLFKLFHIFYVYYHCCLSLVTILCMFFCKYVWLYGCYYCVSLTPCMYVLLYHWLLLYLLNAMYAGVPVCPSVCMTICWFVFDGHGLQSGQYMCTYVCVHVCNWHVSACTHHVFQCLYYSAKYEGLFIIIQPTVLSHSCGASHEGLYADMRDFIPFVTGRHSKSFLYQMYNLLACWLLQYNFHFIWVKILSTCDLWFVVWYEK